jgi:hypothetical protein
VDLEHVLCQIKANCRNLHSGRSFRFEWLMTLPLWHIDAVWVGASIPLLTDMLSSTANLQAIARSQLKD